MRRQTSTSEPRSQDVLISGPFSPFPHHASRGLTRDGRGANAVQRFINKGDNSWGRREFEIQLTSAGADASFSFFLVLAALCPFCLEERHLLWYEAAKVAGFTVPPPRFPAPLNLSYSIIAGEPYVAQTKIHHQRQDPGAGVGRACVLFLLPLESSYGVIPVSFAA